MVGINSSNLYENDNIGILVQLLLIIKSSYNYQNIIIISHIDFAKSADFNLFIYETERSLSSPLLIFTVPQKGDLKMRISKDSLSVIFLTEEDYTGIFEIVHYTLLGFRTNKAVFVLKKGLSLEHLIEWMWIEQFVNSIVLWEDSIYGFNPFPEMQITTPNISEYFPFKKSRTSYDLKRYQLKTPATPSIPRLYIITDESGTNTLSGVNGYLFLHFLDFMNMSWEGFNKKYWMKVFNESGINSYNSLSKYTIQFTSAEIAAESPLTVQTVFSFDNSYPTDVVDLCLMIPVHNALPKYLYVLRPFSMNLWLLLIVLVFYIAILYYILVKLTYFRNKKVDFFVCFQQAFATVFNSSNIIAFKLPRISWIILFIPLFVFGFVIYSYYTTYIAAFLTTILYEKDVETMEDLVHSNIKLMVVDWQLERVIGLLQFKRTSN